MKTEYQKINLLYKTRVSILQNKSDRLLYVKTVLLVSLMMLFLVIIYLFYQNRRYKIKQTNLYTQINQNATKILVPINNGLESEFKSSDLKLDSRPFSSKLITYIMGLDSLMEIKIIDLANHISVSERQLYRILKRETGLTSNEFLQELKLKYAFKMLEESKAMSIKQLSILVGYDNYDYFSRLFKKRFGHRPIEFFKQGEKKI